MKISFSSFTGRLKQINGISTPVFGLQWHPKDSERDVARRVVVFCEDRRVLFAPHNIEMKAECEKSAIEIRQYLTTELGRLDSKSELAKRLAEMRAACRDFLDALRADELKSAYVSNQMVHGKPREALDALRLSFCYQIFWIVMSHGLEVEEQLTYNFQDFLESKSRGS